MEKKRRIEGIGGWLTVLLVPIGFIFLGALINMFQSSGGIRIYFAILFVFMFLCLWALFSKKKIAPKLWIALLIFLALNNILSLFSGIIPNIVVSIILLTIWLPFIFYFFKSERVKNTFINKIFNKRRVEQDIIKGKTTRSRITNITKKEQRKMRTKGEEVVMRGKGIFLILLVLTLMGLIANWGLAQIGFGLLGIWSAFNHKYLLVKLTQNNFVFISIAAICAFVSGFIVWYRSGSAYQSAGAATGAIIVFFIVWLVNRMRSPKKVQ